LSATAIRTQSTSPQSPTSVSSPAANRAPASHQACTSRLLTKFVKVFCFFFSKKKRFLLPAQRKQALLF
jgi:hypothetical protein